MSRDRKGLLPKSLDRDGIMPAVQGKEAKP